MMTNRWAYSPITAYLIGKVLKGLEFSPQRYTNHNDRVWNLWIELVFVSICHNTNWNKLYDWIVQLPLDKITPIQLSNLSKNQFENLFFPGLDMGREDGSRRRRILNELGSYCSKWPSYNWLLEEPLILGGESGLYRWLDAIPIFNKDPSRKKSRVFIHQLIHNGLVNICDPENILPAIDYHLIRLYLRSGRVEIRKDEQITELHETRIRRIDFINNLRSSVESAMLYTADSANLPVNSLNYFEWQIARSFCTRQAPRCHKVPEPSKPMDKAFIVQFGELNSCPLLDICPAINDSNLLKVVEPQTLHDYY